LPGLRLLAQARTAPAAGSSSADHLRTHQTARERLITTFDWDTKVPEYGLGYSSLRVEHFPSGRKRNGVLRSLTVFRKTVLMFDSLFTAPAIDALFLDEALIKGMLRFESALAATQAELGVIPRTAASVIGECCSRQEFAVKDLLRSAEQDGNPAIPLVKALGKCVAGWTPKRLNMCTWVLPARMSSIRDWCFVRRKP
jgi:hypothetical protein